MSWWGEALSKVRRPKPVQCLICKRELKSAKSRRLGIGPGCAKKNPALAYQAMAEQQGQLRLPLTSQPPTKKGK